MVGLLRWTLGLWLLGLFIRLLRHHCQTSFPTLWIFRSISDTVTIVCMLIIDYILGYIRLLSEINWVETTNTNDDEKISSHWDFQMHIYGMSAGTSPGSWESPLNSSPKVSLHALCFALFQLKFDCPFENHVGVLTHQGTGAYFRILFWLTPDNFIQQTGARLLIG